MHRRLIALLPTWLVLALALGVATCASPVATPTPPTKQSAESVTVSQRTATKPSATSGSQAQPSSPKAQTPQAKAGEWPAWSGPKTLGPGKPLPELWCVQLIYSYKPGYGKILQVTSKGDWSDETIRKVHGPNGKLTDGELATVRDALAGIDWGLVPKQSEKDCVAYHLDPKEPLGPARFTGYRVAYWAGQTHTSPGYNSQNVLADLRAPCAPEAEKLVQTLKPLLEKHVPPAENE